MCGQCCSRSQLHSWIQQQDGADIKEAIWGERGDVEREKATPSPNPTTDPGHSDMGGDILSHGSPAGNTVHGETTRATAAHTRVTGVPGLDRRS